MIASFCVILKEKTHMTLKQQRDSLIQHLAPHLLEEDIQREGDALDAYIALVLELTDQYNPLSS
jgi:hypothetical protein